MKENTQRHQRPSVVIPGQTALASLAGVVTDSEHEEAVLPSMALAMPWLLSIFFHLGIAMLSVFLVMLGQIPKVMQSPIEAPTGVSVPIDELADGTPSMSVSPGLGNSDLDPRQPNKIVKDHGWAQVEGSDLKVGDLFAGKTDKTLTKVIGIGGGGKQEGGLLAKTGLDHGGTGGGLFGPPGGIGGNIHHIVYVIDRSGSMATESVFESVKRELLESISRLTAGKQDFHIIMFSSGTPIENPPKKLVVVNDTNKAEASVFVDELRAEGKTDPVPALERALAVLREPAVKGEGKLIHLLTDGAFPDNQAVLDFLRKNNANKEVLINTFLYCHEPGEAAAAMKKIADENGGRYKLIQEDE